MQYLELLEAQRTKLAELEVVQEELDALQAQRTAITHENMETEKLLTSGSTACICLRYDLKDTAIFVIRDTDGDVASFSVEDYNEMSMFFSQHNDAILAYMTMLEKYEEAIDEVTEEA